MRDVPKQSSSTKKSESPQQDVMHFLKNLQDRLDRVEVTLENIQLSTYKETSDEDKKIMLTDSIIDEQISELLMGLREYLDELIRLLFSPDVNLAHYDFKTKEKITELREIITKFKLNLKKEIIEEIKKPFQEESLSKTTGPLEIPSSPKKKSTKRKTQQKKA